MAEPKDRPDANEAKEAPVPPPSEGQAEQKAEVKTDPILAKKASRFVPGEGTKFVLKTVFVGLFSSVLIPLIMGSYNTNEKHSEFFYQQRSQGAVSILNSYEGLYEKYYDLCNEPPATRLQNIKELEDAADHFRRVSNRYLMFFPQDFENITSSIYLFYMGMRYQISGSSFPMDRHRDYVVDYFDQYFEENYRSLFELPAISLICTHPQQVIERFLQPKMKLIDYHPSLAAEDPYQDYYNKAIANIKPLKN